MTNSSGNASFSTTVRAEPGGQMVLTATATDPSGDTSEFSAALVPPSPSLLVTNANDSGPGSLRQAIVTLDATEEARPISFDIPGTGVHTIMPATDLPALAAAGIVDGYPQPGASPNTLAGGDNAVLQIELKGSSDTDAAAGLTLAGGDSIVEGLAIDQFSFPFLLGSNGIFLRSSGNVIAGNLIGTDPSGESIEGNSGGGVIDDSTGGNTIGGTSPADRNVISGNRGAGVLFSESPATGAGGDVLEGNFIGIDATGTRALGNTFTGVELLGTTNNTIGGTAPGAGNVISGNATYGILDYSNNSLIEGNEIGIAASGGALTGASQGMASPCKPRRRTTRSAGPRPRRGTSSPATRSTASTWIAGRTMLSREITSAPTRPGPVPWATAGTASSFPRRTTRSAAPCLARAT